MSNELREYIDGIRVVDAHTHIGSEWTSDETDANAITKKVLLGGYISAYLVSAGMPAGELLSKELTPEEMIARIALVLDSARATGVLGATTEAFTDLYGFRGDFSDREDSARLIDGITSAYSKGQWKRWEELFSLANVEIALKNVELPYFGTYLPSLPETERDVETRLLKVLPRVDSFLFAPFSLRGWEVLDIMIPHMQRGMDGIMDALDMRPDNFDDYLSFVDAAIKAFHDCGSVGVKLTIGYLRKFDFVETDYSRAKSVYNARSDVDSIEQAKQFQDYVMRFILDRLAKHSLPIQIHTGLQSGNDANLPDCSPVSLIPLLRDKRFEDVRFVILHGSYPYAREAGILAKSYPNLFLDFSWLTLLSPVICTRCLAEWLQLVPSTKLIYGSDTHTAENLYAATKRARRVVGDVLESLVDGGHLPPGKAQPIASQLLRENARRVYGLA